MQNNKKWLWVLLALTVFLFFFRLGDFTFFDGDEPKYAQVVKEMVMHNDWATLHYNQLPWFDKPPLYFWVSAALSHLRGLNEISIRLLSALCGLLTVLVTYKLGKALFNEKTGLYAGFILAASLQFILQSRICVLDTTLVFFLTSCLFLFYRLEATNQKHYALAFYVSLGLAVLTKGLIGILLPAAAIFLFILISKQWSLILKLLNPLGILLFALIAMPWYWIEYQLHGQKFIDLVLGFLFWSRFTTAVDYQPGPWYYYLISLTLGFFPFAFLLPYSLIKAFKSWKQKPYLLLLCYIVPIFVVFSAANTKLPNYALPLFPVLSILAAKFWDDLVQSQKQGDYKIGMLLSELFLLLSAVLILIGLLLLGQQFPGPLKVMLPQIQAIGFIVLIFVLLHILFFSLKRYKLAFNSLVLLSTALVLLLIGFTLPAVENFKTSKPIGTVVQSLTKSNESIGAYRLEIKPSVVYYSNRQIVWLNNETELFTYLKQPKKAYFLISRNEYEPLKEKLKSRAKIIKEEWDLLLLSN